MRAVIVGAGRVGCAGLGYVLARAGHEVVFLNRDRSVAERINRHRGYLVQVAENGRVSQDWVGGVRAFCLDDRPAATAAIARAGFVATAVGATSLGAVAPVLAAGLAAAPTATNVVAFENAIDAGATLRRLVLAGLPAGPGPGGRHGFAGGLALRIVARRLVPADPAAPLTFVADPEHRLVVDNRGLTTGLPDADGLAGTDAYDGWIAGKLFTLNAAHAAAAYLGHLKGYQYVHAAVRDPQIRQIVAAVAHLGRAGTAARYPGGAGVADPAGVLRRLDNAALNDTVERVGRDPLRKLVPAERLAGAAAWASGCGEDTGPLALVIAAALRYARVSGVSTGPAVRLLRDVCQLDPDRGTGRLVLRHVARLAAVPDGAVAVDLNRMSWAWHSPRENARSRGDGHLRTVA